MPATLTTHDDGKHVRTAVVIDDSASLALVNDAGELLAVVNVFAREGWLAVDVIDTADRYDHRRVLAFNDGTRSDLDTGTVAAVDFRATSTPANGEAA